MTAIEVETLELNLLREFEEPASRIRRRRAVIASAALHAAMVAALIANGPIFRDVRTAVRPRPDQVTLLFTPPLELTQKAPNRAPPSKLFLGRPEPFRPPLLMERPTPAPSVVPAPKGDLSAEEKPPQLTPRPDALGAGQLTQIPPPEIAAPPKLSLQDAHSSPSGRPGQQQTGALAPQSPGAVIEGAVRDLSRTGGRGGQIVGDGYSGGVPGGFTLPSPGNVGSNLELLSDPMGVDFRPYLTRILAAVRRNWYAVLPESARLGMVRGRVAIQFIIVRAGSVSKLVIATPSGHEPLDRAAVAGISASNPFPPLPGEFRGPEVRLQFTFLYNIPVQ